MLHNVTIIDEPAGEFHVHIVDSIDEQESASNPPTSPLEKGIRVNYHSHGDFTHTATQKDDATTAH